MGTKNDPGMFDCYAKLEDDEPFFVLRAKDRKAPELVELWAERSARSQSDLKRAKAQKCAGDMRLWRARRDEEESREAMEKRRRWHFAFMFVVATAAGVLMGLAYCWLEVS